MSKYSQMKLKNYIRYYMSFKNNKIVFDRNFGRKIYKFFV